MTPKSSITAIRFTLGYIYLHFGLQKFYPDLSPAEIIVDHTTHFVTFSLFDTFTAQLMVATMECVIGIALLFNFLNKGIALLYFFHILCTFIPLLILPEYMFKVFPFVLKTEGQYILKNLVLVAAGWALFGPLFSSTNNNFAKKRLLDARKPGQ